MNAHTYEFPLLANSVAAKRILYRNGEFMPGLTGESAAPFVPEDHSLAVLREAIKQCRGCDLYKHATQAVFGEIEDKGGHKRPNVSIMMIGEQPGDREDVEGRPFVGPAGKLLDRCLKEAAIDRLEVYITNAVKHFKWEPRGKLRLHKKPSLTEIRACRPWLDAEIDAMRPSLIVCLGATSAQGLLGSNFKVTVDHGVVQQLIGLPPIIATLHPSAILRAATEEDGQRQTETLVNDLREAKRVLSSLPAAS
ncbi:UdgX family uracil-DNA binding protein [Acidisarcina polymorpha]|nr:UdgX family uracil-DNA binding protein [Acidisarcina polymorpha]